MTLLDGFLGKIFSAAEAYGGPHWAEAAKLGLVTLLGVVALTCILVWVVVSARENL